MSDTINHLADGGVAAGEAGAASANGAASGEASGQSKARRRTGGGLAAMLLPELQALASDLGITGTARMRKGQLIEAIQAKQGGAAGASTATDEGGSRTGGQAERRDRASEPAGETRTGEGANREGHESRPNNRPNSQPRDEQNRDRQ